MSGRLTVTWLREYDGEIQTITLPSKDGRENNPFRRGVGIYKDTEGIVWEVKGMWAGATLEESFILARPMTASKKWVPYKIEIERTGK